MSRTAPCGSVGWNPPAASTLRLPAKTGSRGWTPAALGSAAFPDRFHAGSSGTHDFEFFAHSRIPPYPRLGGCGGRLVGFFTRNSKYDRLVHIPTFWRSRPEHPDRSEHLKCKRPYFTVARVCPSGMMFPPHLGSHRTCSRTLGLVDARPQRVIELLPVLRSIPVTDVAGKS